METSYSPTVFSPDIQFKSYYVVWKLSIDTEKEYEYDEFKSYYVVWKLSETNF